MRTALVLPATDLDALKARVRALAEDRPGVYRMTDPSGRVLYVGKAKRLRTRLISYFRAAYPDDKAARILHASHDIAWDVVPSEFAAYLGELRAIRKHRPPFNWRMNRKRKEAFVAVSGGPAPRLTLSAKTESDDVRRYGPLTSPGMAEEALRILNDLLGLRRGSPLERMDMSFANQALAAEYLAKNVKSLKKQVYAVPEDIDKENARLKLAAMGVRIDTLTLEQEQYLHSWEMGT